MTHFIHVHAFRGSNGRLCAVSGGRVIAAIDDLRAVRTAAPPGVRAAPRLLCISCFCDSLCDDGYRERRRPGRRRIDARTAGQTHAPGPGIVAFFEQNTTVTLKTGSRFGENGQETFWASTPAASFTAVSPHCRSFCPVSFTSSVSTCVL